MASKKSIADFMRPIASACLDCLFWWGCEGKRRELLCEQTLNTPGKCLIPFPNDTHTQTHMKSTSSSTSAGGKKKKQPKIQRRQGRERDQSVATET